MNTERDWQFADEIREISERLRDAVIANQSTRTRTSKISIEFKENGVVLARATVEHVMAFKPE